MQPRGDSPDLEGCAVLPIDDRFRVRRERSRITVASNVRPGRDRSDALENIRSRTWSRPTPCQQHRVARELVGRERPERHRN
jgi:hypothetical protein